MNGTRMAFWILVALCAAAPVRATSRSGHNMSVSTDHDGPIDDCRQVRVTFDHGDAARAEETLDVASARGALRMRSPVHSGIHVQGSDRRDFSVTACKAAALSQDLARISVSFEDGELTLRGPENRDWLVYLIVRAPRGANLDLQGGHGPGSVRGLSRAVPAPPGHG